MRRVDGLLLVVPGVSNDPAPFVQVILERHDWRERVFFLIDSGSDSTVLMPKDAFLLLGERLSELNFDDDRAVVMSGIGEGEFRILPLDVRARLEDDTDSPLELAAQVWVAEPRPREESEVGNWLEPSIFGRDAIRPGDFELSYTNNTVTLIRPSDE